MPAWHGERTLRHGPAHPPAAVRCRQRLGLLRGMRGQHQAAMISCQQLKPPRGRHGKLTSINNHRADRMTTHRQFSRPQSLGRILCTNKDGALKQAVIRTTAARQDVRIGEALRSDPQCPRWGIGIPGCLPGEMRQNAQRWTPRFLVAPVYNRCMWHRFVTGVWLSADRVRRRLQPKPLMQCSARQPAAQHRIDDGPPSGEHCGDIRRCVAG